MTTRLQAHSIVSITVQRKLFEDFDCTEIVMTDDEGNTTRIDAFANVTVALATLADHIAHESRRPVLEAA